MQEIVIGTSHTSSLTVTGMHTAIVIGSGNLPVLGTPAMTALMEKAAMLAVKPFLDYSPKEESSVGISLEVTHDRATAVGDTVSATAVVTAVDGRRIDFEVSATDSQGRIIGRGVHARFVVEVEKFMGKIEK